MLNLTGCLCTMQTFLCGQRHIFSHVYNELSTVVNVEHIHFHCSSEDISTTFILSCTTWMCFQMNCSVTPRWHLTRHLNIHKKPSGWSLWSGNCSTPVSWELSPALQRWAFHTSWTAQVFEHLLIHWPHQMTISCTQNSQYCWLGFDCENLQIVNISHSMRYNGLTHLIRVSSYGWHCYFTRLLVSLWGVWVATLYLDTRINQVESASQTLSALQTVARGHQQLIAEQYAK